MLKIQQNFRLVYWIIINNLEFRSYWFVPEIPVYNVKIVAKGQLQALLNRLDERSPLSEERRTWGQALVAFEQYREGLKLNGQRYKFEDHIDVMRNLKFLDLQCFWSIKLVLTTQNVIKTNKQRNREETRWSTVDW